MDKNNQQKIFELDAGGQSVGRLASKVAKIIQGKTGPDYQPNKIPLVKVIITNIKNLRINDKQLQKFFYRHTNYPGGLKKTKWESLFKKSPKLLFLKVIQGMLPNNRQKKHLLKNILFE